MVRIWFNRHYSTIGRVLLLLRQAPDPLPLWSLVSHRQRHFSGFSMADHALLEPYGLDAEAYLAWCLTVVPKFGITHLVPGHEGSFLTRHAADFRAIGCEVLEAASPEILGWLHRKDWVYEQLDGVVPVPAYEVATDLDRALEAIARLGREGEVCVKPSVSVYGKGFYRFVEEGAPVGSDFDTVAGWTARCRRARDEFPRHLVMRYLPGPEFSVDIAARQGEVLACAIRRKGEAEKVQVIVDHPDLQRHARAMVQRFRANGLINIQFRSDTDGNPQLLEINPRASGGLGMSCQSGLNLPDIAYRAAFFPDRPLRIPPAKTGIRVTEISLAVTLPQPDASAMPAAP